MIRPLALFLALVAPFAVAAVEPDRREFIVYFGFGSAAINPAGERIVDEAAAAIATRRMAKEFGHAKVIGYADAAGSAAASHAISEQRAEAVRTRLVARGVPPDLVTIEPRGHRAGDSASGARIRDQRNRRVRIVIFAPGE
jgi:outer membrane protein OmpA-like peptidoglycan-associated protein